MKNSLKLSLIILLCYGQQLFSQQVITKIKVTDTNKQPLFGTGVLLSLQADSSVLFSAITDSAGVATFNVSESNYWLSVSSVGYKSIYRGIKIVKSNQKFEIVLQPVSQNLTEVTVRAKKPLLRQEDDKTIVDTEPLAATSTNVYEIIEKTPGIFLDQDGNVYLNSTTPATVYINGREQKMSAADIATILKSLPPNSVESIEIMRTPSAKYDASGSGGVVNIVLKKGVKIGLTGSLNAGANQGRFGSQFAGFNVSNVDGGRSSYLNLSYNRRNFYDSLTSMREITKERFISHRAYNTTPSDALFLGFGIGREPTKKMTVGTDTRISYNPYNSKNTNINTQTLNGILSGLSNNITDNQTKTLSIDQGFSSKLKIDTLGSELTTDWSYNYFNKTSSQELNNIFTAPSSTNSGSSQPSMWPTASYGNFGNYRHLFMAQIDLKLYFKTQIVLETGLKSSYQSFISQTQFSNKIQEQITADYLRTNAYTYQENINAAYLQASKSWGPLVLKVGTRLENTNMTGTQTIPEPTSFAINRTDLFPYLYFSRKVAKIAGYELRAFLVARRSITRPLYDALNPGIRVIDQYLYETGNPELRPQFTQTYEANISVDEAPLIAIGRNYTEDIFANVLYQDPDNKNIAYRTHSNLGTNKETYFRLMGGIPPVGKYFCLVVAQYTHNEYEGVYENSPINFKRGSWRFYSYHQYRINKRSSVIVNGFVSVNGQAKLYELGDFGALNLSANRSFLDKKLTVTVNVTDVFFTNPNTLTLNQGLIRAINRMESDTRRVGINVRYNFGIKKNEEKNNMFNVEG